MKRHGGWRNDAIHSYVKETVANLLQPSRATCWESVMQARHYAFLLCVCVCSGPLPGKVMSVLFYGKREVGGPTNWRWVRVAIEKWHFSGVDVTKWN